MKTTPRHNTRTGTPAHTSPGTCTRNPSDTVSDTEQRFHIWIRQPDRRLYPCTVLSDERGYIAVHATPKGLPVSTVTMADVAILQTFRSAHIMRLKPVPTHRVIVGRWAPENPKQHGYMMSRPDVAKRPPFAYFRIQRQLDRYAEQARARARASIFDPHATSVPFSTPPLST